MSNHRSGLALMSIIPPLLGVRRAKRVVNELLQQVNHNTISTHTILQLEKTLHWGREELEKVSSNLRELERTLERDKDARVGRFLVGEVVEWQPAGKREVHRGKVLATVEACQYPDIVMKEKLPEKKCNVRYRGYYRYEESYIIEDDKGQQWWPRVGWLRRV